MKQCSHCKAVLPVDHFGAATSRRDGLKPWCKSCTRAKRAVYDATPDAKLKARTRHKRRQALQRATLADSHVAHKLDCDAPTEQLVRMQREQLLIARAVAMLERAAMDADVGIADVTRTTDDLRRRVLDLVGGLPDGTFEAAAAAQLHAAILNLGEAISLAINSL